MDRNGYRIGGIARLGFETECFDAEAQCYGGATLKRIRHSLRKHTHSQRQERNPETESVTMCDGRDGVLHIPPALKNTVTIDTTVTEIERSIK